MDNTKLKAIFVHFGKDLQRLKAIEEMAECQQALVKQIFAGDNAQDPSWAKAQDEIADALVVLHQLRLFYGAQEIDVIANEKINRTLKAINSTPLTV